MSKASALRAANTESHTSRPGTQTGQSQKARLAITSITTSTKNASQNTQQKKIPRKSSKPLLTWFQRKLGGSVKGKRPDAIAIGIADVGVGSPQGAGRVGGRTASSPLPQPTGGKRPPKRHSTAATQRTTLSFTDEYPQSFNDDGASLDRSSSFARESLWSPHSALEADDDASVRPLPPTTPPSPSPSRSSSSVLSDPRTFRSMAASTKPTTVLSIEIGNGMAHIAQVPANVPTNPVHRIAPHVRHSSSLSSPAHLSSGNSITFSAFPTSPPQSSESPSVRNFGSISSLNFNPAAPYAPGSASSHVQAPLHTSHHPRNNPRPSSPPLDNASMLTLASSAYALPARTSATLNYNFNALPLGDNTSHYGGSVLYPDGESTSQFLGDDDRLDDRDIDASVRALRPRSSRRGSWESEASRWSARVQAGGGTPSLMRGGSLWASNSIRTGALSTELNGGDLYDQSKEDDFEGRLDPYSVTEDATLENQEPNLGDAPLKKVNGEKEQEEQKPSEPTKGLSPAQLHRPSVETIGSPTIAKDDAEDSPSPKEKSPLNEKY